MVYAGMVIVLRFLLRHDSLGRNAGV